MPVSPDDPPGRDDHARGLEDGRRWRFALEASGDGVVDYDTRRQTLFLSKAAAAPIGLEEGEVEPRAEFLSRCHPEDRNRVAAVVRDCMAGSVTSFAQEIRLGPAEGPWRWVMVRGGVVERDPAGIPTRIVGTCRDVSARHQQIAALKRAESVQRKLAERLTRAQHVGGLGVWETDLRTLHVEWSRELHGIFETNPETFLPTHERFLAHVHPDDRETVHNAFVESIASKELSSIEHRIITAAGAIRHVRETWQVLGDGGEGDLVAAGICLDISEWKRVEEVLRESLRLQQGLLMEVHHRVKNNLQVMSSLLRLESGRSISPETRVVLKDMQARVRAMAVMHQTLYSSGSFSEVDLGKYLRELGTQAMRAQGLGTRYELAFEVDAGIMASLNVASPCGLLVNELLTNAFKYAFPEGRTGEVTLGLLRQPDGSIALSISDDGVGLPEDFETRSRQSLGLQLVGDLCQQLGGAYSVSRTPRTRFEVVFTLGSGSY